MEELIEREEEAYFTAKEDEYEYGKSQVDELESTYIAAKESEKEAKAIMDQAKHGLEVLYSQGHEPRKLTVTHATRKGNVDMKELQRKFNIMDDDINDCRKSDIEYVTYKVKS